LSNVTVVSGYFDKYIDCFQGNKKDSYIRFKALNARIANKEHLDPITRESLKVEAKAINPLYIRKSK
jgi:hypothetical protein